MHKDRRFYLNRDEFILKHNVRKIVEILLRSSDNMNDTSRVAKELNIRESILNMELMMEIKKYPIIQFDKKKKIIKLRHDLKLLYNILKDVFYEISKKYITMWRFEREILYAVMKSTSIGLFYDNVSYSIFKDTSKKVDYLSKFYLYQILLISSELYGPLKSSTCNKIIHWRCMPLKLHEIQTTGNILLPYGYDDEPTFITDNNKLIKNPILLLSEQNTSASLNNLVNFYSHIDVMGVHSKHKMHVFQWPSLYPWSLNHNVELIIDVDYCSSLKRDYNITIDQSITSHELLEIMSHIVNSDNNNLVQIFNSLNTLCYNVQELKYNHNDKIYKQNVSFPISIDDPHEFGRVLWAITDLPIDANEMNFSWFHDVVNTAIKTTNLIGVTTNEAEYLDNDILFLSEDASNIISKIARNNGFLLNSSHFSEAVILRINSINYLKKIGLTQKNRSPEKPTQLLIKNLAFEIVERLFQKTTQQDYSVDQVSEDLAIPSKVICDFIPEYLSTCIDIFPNGTLRVKNDPWIEFRV